MMIPVGLIRISAVTHRRVGAAHRFAVTVAVPRCVGAEVRKALRERDSRCAQLGNYLQIEYRWANDENLYRRFAHELVALTPDLVLAVSGSSATASKEVTNAIPVVFMGTSDSVNRRLIATMEKPGGNFTGFIEFESSIGGKWLELLKQTAPSVTRVAVLRHPTRLA